MNYRYEAHIVPGKVWDAVKIGDDYFGGVVVEGSSGMDNDLVLIVAYLANTTKWSASEMMKDIPFNG